MTASTELSDAHAERFATNVHRLHSNIATVIKGKDEIITLALVCFFAEGHLLIEDVPGVGKTQLAHALARSIDASSQRIQFTPDLLPSDVTGVTIFHQATQTFEFHRGPIFGNIVLADEINRASPRTQSALLEVMEERQVTMDGEAHQVPRPFMVVATQNPIDMDGTYPLPEAQLDRFLMRTPMGYPDLSAEREILLAQNGQHPGKRLSAVLSHAEVVAMVGAVHAVHASREVCDYLLQIVGATRNLSEVSLPVSPRGSVGLLHAARSRALGLGRLFVTPEDVRVLAPAVLAHRMVLRPDAVLAGATPESVLERAVAAVAVPHAVSSPEQVAR